MLEKRNIRNSRYGLFETHQKGYGCFDVLHIVDLNNICNKVIDVYIPWPFFYLKTWGTA